MEEFACLIYSLAHNSYFIVITGIASIIGVLFAIPGSRKAVFKCLKISQKNRVGSQYIVGDDNAQAGGSISASEKKDTSEKNSNKVNQQIIIGSGNKQSGGDIDE